MPELLGSKEIKYVRKKISALRMKDRALGDMSQTERELLEMISILLVLIEILRSEVSRE